MFLIRFAKQFYVCFFDSRPISWFLEQSKRNLLRVRVDIEQGKRRTWQEICMLAMEREKVYGQLKKIHSPERTLLHVTS